MSWNPFFPDVLRYAVPGATFALPETRGARVPPAFLRVAAIKNPDPATFRQVFEATPEIVVIEIFAGRSLEGVNLAALRIHTRHDVLDRSVLARRVHRLKNEQHRPAILGIQNILQFRQRIYTILQCFLGPWLILRLQLAGVAWIDILEAEFFSVRNTIGFAEPASGFNDAFGFHGIEDSRGDNCRPVHSKIYRPLVLCRRANRLRFSLNKTAQLILLIFRERGLNDPSFAGERFQRFQHLIRR